MTTKKPIAGFEQGWGGLALLGSGLLLGAFQGCASSPNLDADSPILAGEPSVPPSIITTPEELSADSDGVTASLLASPPTEPQQPNSSESVRHHLQPGDDKCGDYGSIQEPLAVLGIEALKAGRIDPWIYEVDKESGTLRLNKSWSIGREKSAGLNKALDRTNENKAASKALVTALAQLTQPGQCSICTPRAYDIKLKHHVDRENGGEWYTYDFKGEEPSELQMVGCFKALYGQAPKGCGIASYAAVDVQCVVKEPSFFSSGDCKPSDSTTSAPGAKYVSDATTSGCNCGYCGTTKRHKKNGDGTCSPC